MDTDCRKRAMEEPKPLNADSAPDVLHLDSLTHEVLIGLDTPCGGEGTVGSNGDCGGVAGVSLLKPYCQDTPQEHAGACHLFEHESKIEMTESMVLKLDEEGESAEAAEPCFDPFDKHSTAIVDSILDEGEDTAAKCKESGACKADPCGEDLSDIVGDPNTAQCAKSWIACRRMGHGRKIEILGVGFNEIAVPEHQIRDQAHQDQKQHDQPATQTSSTPIGSENVPPEPALNSRKLEGQCVTTTFIHRAHHELSCFRQDVESDHRDKEEKAVEEKAASVVLHNVHKPMHQRVWGTVKSYNTTQHNTTIQYNTILVFSPMIFGSTVLCRTVWL